jgi:hypothetical protein
MSPLKKNIADILILMHIKRYLGKYNILQESRQRHTVWVGEDLVEVASGNQA